MAPSRSNTSNMNKYATTVESAPETPRDFSGTEVPEIVVRQHEGFEGSVEQDGEYLSIHCTHMRV